MEDKKVEQGVMVMKDGKAWGTTYEDGRIACSGWMDAVDAPIHDPEFCTKITDVTYGCESPDKKELLTAKLVRVERTTILKIK